MRRTLIPAALMLAALSTSSGTAEAQFSGSYSPTYGTGPGETAVYKYDPLCVVNRDGRLECSQWFTTSGTFPGSWVDSDLPVELTLIGGRGGNAGDGTPGGRGGQIVTKTAYRSFCIRVGGNGADGGWDGGSGGANGGGRGGNGVYEGFGGGGGGGGTSVHGGSANDPCTSAQALVAVAPGGGGGGSGNALDSKGGGRGGDAGAPGRGVAYYSSLGLNLGTFDRGSGSHYCGGEAGGSAFSGRGGGQAGADSPYEDDPPGTKMGEGCGDFGAWVGQSGSIARGGYGATSTYQCVKTACMLDFKYSGAGGGGGGYYGGGGGGVVIHKTTFAHVAGGGGGGGGTQPATPTTAGPGVKVTWYPRQSPNLVKNGSFELHKITDFSWAHLLEIPNWTNVNGTGFEVQSNAEAADGRQYLELDVFQATKIEQTIPTTPGKRHRIVVRYAGRPGYAPDENSLRIQLHAGSTPIVSWTVSADGRNSHLIDWRTYHISFWPRESSTRITLEDVGPSNGVGMFVDDVRVFEDF